MPDLKLQRLASIVGIFLLLALAGAGAPSRASALQINVPLNQALVLEGGESNNPRDYDPATTHGSAPTKSGRPSGSFFRIRL